MAEIVCFGEVLWDVFPDTKKMGGAPLNVAYRLKSFQHNVILISAIGNDQLGKEIIDFLENSSIDGDSIQILDEYKTGKVSVKLDKQGVATYTIDYPKAWDKIEITTENLKATAKADAFIFGSLATRDQISKTTLFQLLEVANYKVFDVNLRTPFYDYEIIIELMHKADFIKLNEEELIEIANAMQSSFKKLEENLRFIAHETNTRHLCVTKGASGAVLFYDNQMYYHKGYKVKVADTVGAGDSFLAGLIHKIINNEKPQHALDFASAVGALVASKKGANPKLDASSIQQLLRL